MCRNLTASDFGAERSEKQLEWEERERKETEREREHRVVESEEGEKKERRVRE